MPSLEFVLLYEKEGEDARFLQETALEEEEEEAYDLQEEEFDDNHDEENHDCEHARCVTRGKTKAFAFPRDSSPIFTSSASEPGVKSWESLSQIQTWRMRKGSKQHDKHKPGDEQQVMLNNSGLPPLVNKWRRLTPTHLNERWEAC